MVVTLDTTPTPAGDEKNFYDIFMCPKILPKSYCQTTNWGDFTVALIYPYHATFPFGIALTKAFVLFKVLRLSLFAFYTKVQNSHQADFHTEKKKMKIEVVS